MHALLASAILQLQANSSRQIRARRLRRIAPSIAIAATISLRAFPLSALVDIR
jgi:hypothetical protein